MNGKTRGMICLIIATLVWGYGFVATKISLDYVNPYCLIFFRYGIGLLSMLAVCNAKIFKGLNKGCIKGGGICGVLLFAALILQIVGCNYTTVGKNAFLCSTYVVATPIVCRIFKGIKLKKSVWAAVVICTVGIAVLSLKGDLSIQLGDGLSILSGISYAVYFMVCEDISRENSPISSYAIMLLVGTVVAGVIAFSGGFVQVENIPVIGWFNILYCGILGMFLGFLLQIIGQRYVEPTITGIVLTLESVFGTILSVAMLGEEVTFSLVAGSVLIFSSIVVCKVK